LPFDATAPNLDVLLIATAIEMELSDRDLQVASKRYNLIAEHLQRPGGALANYMDDALVYAQGSRAIGAIIVDGSSDDRFDLDAILEFRMPPGWQPKRVLEELFDAFQGFPNVQKVVRCTRCVQLQFAFMHLDVTPMNPFAAPRQERAGNIYHSPDKGSDALFSVNPYGFAHWFRQTVKQPSRQFQDHVRAMRGQMTIPDRIALDMVFADAETDKLPEPIDPLRDAPQVIALKLLKRYLNLRYAPRDRKRPVSIYLSKVAAEVPLNTFGLCAQLEALASELDRRIAVALASGQRPEERNPVFREENFNDRWPKDATDMVVFRGDLQHLLAELARARESELSKIQEIFDQLFGERVTQKAVRKYLDDLSDKAAPAAYERGKGFLAAPALVATSAPTAAATASAPQVSRAPAHSFHFGLLK
jgi:hypothetical protein